MTDPRLRAPVSKDDSGYRRVQSRCLKLRRAGRIPFSWIADTSRMGYHVPTYSGGKEFIKAHAGLYRARLWNESLPRVEVWTESRSLAGVLLEDCEEMGISLYPAGGFSSASLLYDAADTANRSGNTGLVVLYCGDYDPAGVLIDRSIETGLLQHLEIPLTFRRLAINEEQIAEYDLPTKPRKASERRRRDITGTVEAESLPAGTLRQLVRDAVLSYLPDGRLDTIQAAEESEREGLARLAEIGEQEGYISA